ncbi:MAG: hypothetical protein JO112_07005 [Planctomycetes bacterium]|nr:hypothetical protein [Planctomycetota bacterium]
MTPPFRLLGVADTSLDLGQSPVPELMISLARHYGAEPLVLEPDTPGPVPRHHFFPDLEIKRLYTGIPPATRAGRIAYILAAVREIHLFRPDLLVVFGTFALPVLFRLHDRPPFVIYYLTGPVLSFGQNEVRMNRAARPWLDLLLFPEEDQAVQDVERCLFQEIPLVILLPCVHPPEERNWDSQFAKVKLYLKD